MNTFLLVGIVIVLFLLIVTLVQRDEDNSEEVRDRILVVLHVLPRTDSLNAEELWRHPLVNYRPSTSRLKSIITQMDVAGLLTIHPENHPAKYGTWLRNIRVRLTNDGHAAARKIAKQEAMKRMDTEHF